VKPALQQRPTVVLVMAPALTEELRSPTLMRRLHEVCLVPDEQPLPDFGDPRADTLLKQAEILLTGFGRSSTRRGP
jgi:hypothetical protein